MVELKAMNEYNETLGKLLNGIEKLLSFQTINAKTYLEFYTLGYNLSQSQSTKFVESRLSITATGRQKYLLQVGADSTRRVCGGKLYYDIQNYLMSYVQNLHQMSDDMRNEDLLQFYTDQWNKYRPLIIALHYTLSYLYRYWMRIAHDRGSKGIYEIDILAMLIWQEIFLKPISNRLTSVCFTMIETERQNHVLTNIHFIKDVVESFKAFNFNNDMLMWLNDELITISAVNVYNEWFEVPFLENTKRFYQIKSNKNLSESFIEYLTKVTRYLNEEEHRIHSYLRLPSSESLITMIEEILIHNHLNDIYNEVKHMLNNNDYKNLKHFFESIKRISILKIKLKPIIQDHIYQIGYQSIEEISSIAIKDPKIFVKTIVEINEKLSEFVQDICLNDSIFVDAFNQACAKFININTMTNGAKNSSILLAQYCDKLCSNKILEESEFEKDFNDIMIVLNYIEDKDTFELWYRKFFSKRLINQQNIRFEYEEIMISKLKEIYGITYTSKLEKMLQDINLSQDFMNQYQTYCKNQQIIHTFHFSGLILSSNLWTLSISKDFILPDKLKFILNHFIQFYKSQHNGRKLELHSQYSTGELEMFSIKQTYILQVSIYQMIILLLFNESTEWTIEQLQNRTKLQVELLLTCVHNLIKSKILISDNEINVVTSTVRIVEDFRNKKIRINLNIPIKFIEPKEITNAHRIIDDDRKFFIQAIIIRIMKTRQTLKYALLIKEVIEQVSSRFKIEIPAIKKSIDILIEKELLKRDSNDKDTLCYLA